MSSDNGVIAVSNVTKTYRVGVGRARVREMTPPPFDRGLSRLFPTWWTRNCFDALDDVSLSVPSGSCVGIVGHNGAGKTTLLKLIAGVSAPTRGSVKTVGKVAALLDVVVGFHPDLTGRENLTLLGGILGFDRRAIGQRTPEILEFAEIPQAADTPVKRYSAGMIARLGFAAITAMDIDVLLIDEVLAVGDAAFQRKCMDWLDGYRHRGGTLLFVSHNLALVRGMTEHVVWLDQGRLVADGETGSVLAEYARAMEQREPTPPMGRRKRGLRSVRTKGLHRWGAGGARVDELRIVGPIDGSLVLSVNYEPSGIDGDRLCIGFLDESGAEVGATLSPPVAARGSDCVARCEINSRGLSEGIYFPVVAIVSEDGTVRDHWTLERAVVVEREDATPRYSFGFVQIPATWSIPNGDATSESVEASKDRGRSGGTVMDPSSLPRGPVTDSDG